MGTPGLVVIDCLFVDDVAAVLKHVENTAGVCFTLNQSGYHSSGAVAVATGTRYLRFYGLTPEEETNVRKVADEFIATLVEKRGGLLSKNENLSEMYMH